MRYINGSIGRTGTLWEGRYKASLVDEEHYVMTCIMRDTALAPCGVTGHKQRAIAQVLDSMLSSQ